jgi:3-keto-L-gulonate-6-phosphate decarboxylase
MNTLAHPHRTTKHVSTISAQFDYEKLQAIVVEGSLDTEFTYTTVEDIGNIVARAVDYEGTWPVIGGVSGDRLTVRELLRLAVVVRGKSIQGDKGPREPVLYPSDGR